MYRRLLLLFVGNFQSVPWSTDEIESLFSAVDINRMMMADLNWPLQWAPCVPFSPTSQCKNAFHSSDCCLVPNWSRCWHNLRLCQLCLELFASDISSPIWYFAILFLHDLKLNCLLIICSLSLYRLFFSSIPKNMFVFACSSANVLPREFSFWVDWWWFSRIFFENPHSYTIRYQNWHIRPNKKNSHGFIQTQPLLLSPPNPVQSTFPAIAAPSDTARDRKQNWKSPNTNNPTKKQQQKYGKNIILIEWVVLWPQHRCMQLNYHHSNNRICMLFELKTTLSLSLNYLLEFNVRISFSPTDSHNSSPIA